MFTEGFSNMIIKGRCPRCNGNLLLDVHTKEIKCLMCSRPLNTEIDLNRRVSKSKLMALN